MPAVAHRLSMAGPELRRLPRVSWSIVAISVLLGAMSHLAWDSEGDTSMPIELE
jgi:hypothetical protein